MTKKDKNIFAVARCMMDYGNNVNRAFGILLASLGEEDVEKLIRNFPDVWKKWKAIAECNGEWK